MRLAVYAMSLLPRESSVPVLATIAKEWQTNGQYLTQAIGDAIVLLSIQGGNDCVALLEAIDTNGQLRHLSFLDRTFHDYVVDLKRRVAMPDATDRENRRQAELTYWQCSYDHAPGRVIRVMLLQAAWRHNRNKVQISRELLRLRLPERYAIAVAGVQDERSLIPDVQSIAEEGGRTAETARVALELMGKNAASTRSSGPSGDTD